MNTTFPGFKHPASELSAYIFCLDFFVLSLVNTDTAHFTPPDVAAFRAWLDGHHIRDITTEVGDELVNHYRGLRQRSAGGAQDGNLSGKRRMPLKVWLVRLIGNK